LAVIGKSGLSIITRLMGLILAVIGTQMVIIGVSAVVKAMG
jgi:multiple antibiotic resistance protein